MSASDRTLHDDELVVDEALVRQLVARDQPGWADRDVRRLEANGSSNVLFRLGDDLLVRVPRPAGRRHQHRHGGQVAAGGRPGASVAVPEVVHVGEPGFGHPTRWSVERWLDGAAPSVPAGGDRRALADVVLALRDLARPWSADSSTNSPPPTG